MTANNGLIAPTNDSELETIRKVLSTLNSAQEGDEKYYIEDQQDGVKIELPHSLFLVLKRASEQLLKGNSVSILHYEEELTSQQAADFLQVSRPYLIQLLDEGMINYHKVGSHRRIRLCDLMAYKQNRDDIRRAELQEMVRASEALGLYDDEDEFEPPEQE